jgi:hypothetical protein
MLHLFLPKLRPEKPKPFAACHAVPSGSSGGFKQVEKRKQSGFRPNIAKKEKKTVAFSKSKRSGIPAFHL